MVVMARVICLALLCHARAPSVGDGGQTGEQAATCVEPAHARSTLFKTTDMREIDCFAHYWRRRLSDRQFLRLTSLLVQDLGRSLPCGIHDIHGVFIPGHDELKVDEHGFIYNQDIFFGNGRAAYVLEMMLGCKLPAFVLKGVTDPAQVRANLAASRRVVLTTLRWPAPVRQEKISADKADEAALDAVQALIEADGYAKMIDLVDGWKKDFSEPVLKALLLAVLDRLGYTDEAVISAPGQMFVMSRFMTHEDGLKPDGEMVEQDVYFVNGRCAWAIEKLLGCILPSFTAAKNKDPKALEDLIGRSYGVVIESMALPPRKPVEHRVKPFGAGVPKE